MYLFANQNHNSQHHWGQKRLNFLIDSQYFLHLWKKLEEFPKFNKFYFLFSSKRDGHWGPVKPVPAF